MKPQKAKVTIVSVEPGTLLEYAIFNLGGLAKAFRYIEIEPLEPGSCTVCNRATMTGLFAGLLRRALGEKVGKGLRGKNEALKTKVEGA